MTSFNILASRSVICAVDVLQFRMIIMRRILHYKAPIGKGTLSVSDKLHPLDRLVHFLTYQEVAGYVYG